MIALPDVNVLIALLDANHIHHSPATRWLLSESPATTSLCAITVNGVARILGRVEYKDGPGSVNGALMRLSQLSNAMKMSFCSSDISLLDESRFRRDRIHSHHQTTDVFLLGLAVRHSGRLVTFDRTIRLDAVIGAEDRHRLLLS